MADDKSGYYRSAPPPRPGEPSPVGILLTNIGTPDAPTARALRPYLAQFLGDRRVAEFPAWFWQPVLHGIVLNTRPRKSAKMYQRIWTEEGSPILAIMRRQAEALEKQINAAHSPGVKVTIGMAYGNPSIGSALRELDEANARRILIFPLFPQYSATTTAASIDVAFAELKHWRRLPELRTINQYYDHPLYIHSLASSIQEQWARTGQPQRLLFSFHGIPQNYVAKGDPYQDQCLKTAELVADSLNLSADQWFVSFQSRLGPVEWIRPFTDETLLSWGQEGLSHVDVLSPGFAADCLETIDELGHEGKSEFQEAGGGQFNYIPALNDRADHIAALAAILDDHLGGWLQEESGKKET